jgi:phage shock protein E
MHTFNIPNGTKVTAETRRKYGIRLLVGLVALTLLLFLAMWWDIRSAPHVAAADLVADIDRVDAPLVVDVRSVEEFTRGHVPGAVNVPFFSYTKLAAIAAPKDRPVAIYCELGPRAAWARWMMRVAGFADVKHLDGHMAGWRDGKFPTESAAVAKQ